MKQLCILGICLLLAHFSTAQKIEWKALHDFHEVMSGTFHPAEENNLQPVRDSAAVLVARAKQWKQSAVPAGYKASVVRPVIAKLLRQCQQLQQAVKAGATDAALKVMITEAHDIFHAIVEKCREAKQ